MNASKTILIVEDHDESRFLYGEILRTEDYVVHETSDGKEALDYLASNPAPSLIVMDLTFPYMTSKEFVDALRNEASWSNIPLLIISGQHDIHEQARELKAASFIKKPFDMDPFLETIRRLA